MFLTMFEGLDESLLAISNSVTRWLEKISKLDCFAFAWVLVPFYIAMIGVEGYMLYLVGKLFYYIIGFVLLSFYLFMLFHMSEAEYRARRALRINRKLGNPNHNHLLGYRFIGFAFLFSHLTFLGLADYMFIKYPNGLLGIYEKALIYKGYSAGIIASMIQIEILYLLSCTPRRKQEKSKSVQKST